MHTQIKIPSKNQNMFYEKKWGGHGAVGVRKIPRKKEREMGAVGRLG